MVGVSFASKYTNRIYKELNTSFTRTGTFSALFVSGIVLSCFFAILSFFAVHILFVQEMKMEYRRFGLVKPKKNLPGTWTSKRLTWYIKLLAILYILASCWYVLEVAGIWGLYLWYGDINSASQTVEEQLAHHSLTAEEEAQIQDDYANLGNSAVFLCPSLYCLNLKAIAFINSQQCVCDSTTIGNVHGWSIEAQKFYLVALVGACLLFLATLILGMRCMLAGAKVQIRLQHWEYMQPVLLSADMENGRNRERTSSAERMGRQRNSVVVETPEGVFIAEGQQRDSEPLYFPEVERGSVGGTEDVTSSVTDEINELEGPSNQKQEEASESQEEHMLDSSEESQASVSFKDHIVDESNIVQRDEPQTSEVSAMDGTTKRKVSAFQQRSNAILNDFGSSSGKIFRQAIHSDHRKKRGNIMQAYAASPSSASSSRLHLTDESASPDAWSGESGLDSSLTSSVHTDNSNNPFLVWDRSQSQGSID